jgi:hypothetical protein
LKHFAFGAVALHDFIGGVGYLLRLIQAQQQASMHFSKCGSRLVAQMQLPLVDRRACLVAPDMAALASMSLLGIVIGVNVKCTDIIVRAFDAAGSIVLATTTLGGVD